MAKLQIHFPDGLVETRELLQDRSLVIGSDENADVRLTGDNIKPKHAIIRWVDRRFRLEVDPSAKNVFVGVNPVSQIRLKPDGEFSINDIEFRVRYGDDEVGAVLIPASDEESMGVARPYKVKLYQTRAFLGIVAGLVVLGLLSVGLYFLVRERTADRMYEIAEQDLNDGLYAKSIGEWDTFLKTFPTDERASEATYLRAKARVLQFTDGSAPSWTGALEAAQAMVDETGKSDEFQKHPTEIGDLFLTIARGLAEQAKQRTDEESLKKSDQAVELLTKAYPPELQPAEGIARARTIQEEARLAVMKGSFTAELLDKMDKSIADNKPIEVYRSQIELIHRYPDLASDRRLSERLAKAATKEGELVHFETNVGIKPVTEAVDVPPAWTRYVLSAGVGLKNGSHRPVSVADVLYGVNAGTGEVTWRHPIGYPVAFWPTPVDDDRESYVAYDALRNDLVVMDAEKGVVRSRLHLGEIRPRAGTAATVYRDRLLITATKTDDDEAGLVLVLRLAGGQLQSEGAFSFPQPVVTPAEVDLQRGTMFVVGQQATMYVVGIERRSTERVIPLGQEVGAIQQRPVIAGRFLFLVQAKGQDDSTLRCLVINADDSSAKETATIDMHGRLSEAPTVRGGRVFIATDHGQYAVYELGAETDVNPLTKAASYNDLEATPGMPAYVRAPTDADFWILSRSAKHFQLHVDRKEMELLQDVALSGHANRESSLVEGGLLAITDNFHAGGIAVVRIEAGRPDPSFISSLGSIPLGVHPSTANGASLLAVYPADRELITRQAIDSGELLPVNHPPSVRREPFDRTLMTVDDWPAGLVQVGGTKLRYAPASASLDAAPDERTLPGPVGGRACTCGGGILIPATNGYVYWIKPENGAELADPFAAPFEMGEPVPMSAVVAMNAADPAAGAIAAGGPFLFKLALSEGTTKVWQQSARVELENSITIKHLIRGGSFIWGITDGAIVAIDPGSLAVSDPMSVSIDETSIAATGDRLFVITSTDQLACIVRQADGSLASSWLADLPSKSVGQPVAQKDGIWVGLADGAAIEISQSDGSERRRVNLNRALLAGPISTDAGLLFLGGDGSICRLELP